MRSIRLFLILFIGIVIFLCPQTAIVNPEKPLNPKAGRVLQLKEELRITDEGGEFFMRFPRIVKVALDGSFFILDSNNLFHLNPKGRYLGNFFKKGQGPGELNYVSNFDFSEDNLIIHSSYPEKLVWFDFRGKFIKEISLAKIPNRLDFSFYADGTYWLFKFATPAPTNKAETVDVPQILMAVSEDGKDIREFMSFPNSSFIMGGAMVMQELLNVPCQERYLFISHTRKYEIAAFDCQSGKLLGTFSRKYNPVKRPKNYGEAAIVVGDKRYEAPGSEYLRDLSGLFVFKDNLWAVTSTKHEKRGVLVDVYNLEGKYIDAFYLNLKGSLVNTHGDSILVREKRPDELIQIVKYRVID
jgi:hypothetical protein